MQLKIRSVHIWIDQTVTITVTGLSPATGNKVGKANYLDILEKVMKIKTSSGAVL